MSGGAGEILLANRLHDDSLQSRYLALVCSRTTSNGCRPWMGAIGGSGHGTFWLGENDSGHDVVIVAHRFGWALSFGLESLRAAQVVRHTCDEPSCQTPGHWAAGTVAQNTAEWAARRAVPGSPLRDLRGARGRAFALREAARSGGDLDAVAMAGLPPADQWQDTLF